MLKAENITFYSHWLPALAPGRYSASVESNLKVPGTPTPTGAARQTFYVDGPRYSFTGSEAYSCYPAPGQIGEFYDTLPHIVFDRCTLPWERTIDGSDPRRPHDPWLALILLTDSDFSSEPTAEKRRVPPVVPMALREVRQPEHNVIGPPALTPAEYDSELLPCQTIDLPARVFAAVMPRTEDLPFLAHVREVETGNKETWSLLKEGKFSVVVCNRFPETEAVATGGKDWGIVNMLCLVSLEGWEAFLKNPDSLDTGKSCRLLVLSSWRFTCQGSSAFKSQMEDLNDKQLLALPQIEGASGDPGLAALNQALGMGFVPVNHDLRHVDTRIADTTISWYRGPLVPMAYERPMSYTDISSADAVLCYDSPTGMFDASYAAAWQLGRLLALQDQAFARALYRFRGDFQRWVRRTNTAALNELATKAKEFQDLFPEPQNIRHLYSVALKQAGYPEPASAGEPRKMETDPPPVPLTVRNWLGQAMLLYGVPFQYLVPDPGMLREGSIRFFYLNPDWINCLLQGACGVGRTNYTDELADQLLRARFFEVSEKLAGELRSNSKHAADQRREEVSDKPPDPSGAQTNPVLQWPVSGYLLRSPAVENWVGLEATAKGLDATGNKLVPLQILRMDRLAPDILLCIYNGKVAEVEVRQPPEAIHFGAATKDGGGHQKTGLRKIGDGGKIASAVPVETRGERVVKVNELASRVKAKLVEAQQMKSDAPFTSAEFAFQMIEAPAKVTFSSGKDLR